MSKFPDYKGSCHKIWSNLSVIFHLSSLKFQPQKPLTLLFLPLPPVVGRYCHCKVGVYLPTMKQGSSLGGPRMREDRSWGSEDPLLPLNALYSVFTVKRPTNEAKKAPHALTTGPSPSLVGLVTVIALYSTITVKNDPHSLTSGPPSFAVIEMRISVSW